MPLPDKHTRLEILKISLKQAQLTKETSLEAIAEMTEGFTGADLVEICNKTLKAVVREVSVRFVTNLICFWSLAN